jgi:hypothetical protein
LDSRSTDWNSINGSAEIHGGAKQTFARLSPCAHAADDVVAEHRRL